MYQNTHLVNRAERAAVGARRGRVALVAAVVTMVVVAVEPPERLAVADVLETGAARR